MPKVKYLKLRKEVVATAKAMQQLGLSPQRSGNVSVRTKAGALITPSGLPYETMKPQDIVEVALNGTAARGQLKPSSETPFHMSIYRAYPEVQAIVHCHSMAATALACARKPVPAFHYMVAAAGGRQIPLAGYETFGTVELADELVRTLQGYKACLMANHGQIATGKSLTAALELAAEVETLSRQYLDVLTIGDVNILDDAEMDRVLERFKDYGKQPG